MHAVPTEKNKLSRSQLIQAIVGPIVGAAVVIALLWPHFDDILDASKQVSLHAFLGLAALQLVALFLRADVWGRCVAAAGAPVEKRLLNSSSSLRFLADTVVPTYVGAFVRIGLVKRFDAPRAAQEGASPTPTIGQMLTADGITFLVEGIITVGLITIAVLTSPLAWWWVIVFGAAMVVVFLLTRWLFKRYEDREFAQTAKVLENAKDRFAVFALLTIVLAIQPVRFYITYKALGLNPTVADGLLGFLLTTVFNALPIGAGPSSIAASATVFAGDGIDKAGAAGFVLLAAAIVAAAIYSVYGVFDISRRMRDRARQVESASSPAPAD